nr:histone deacetylase complex subunit SAP18 [Tanacetum cinerariifolium]
MKLWKDRKKDQVEDSSYEGASTSKLSSKGESHSTSFCILVVIKDDVKKEDEIVPEAEVEGDDITLVTNYTLRSILGLEERGTFVFWIAKWIPEIITVLIQHGSAYQRTKDHGIEDDYLCKVTRIKVTGAFNGDLESGLDHNQAEFQSEARSLKAKFRYILGWTPHFVKEVAPEARRDALLSFAFVYPNKTGHFIVREGVKISLYAKAVSGTTSLDYDVLHFTWTTEKL